MKQKRTLFTLILLCTTMFCKAQTNCTSKITNPSFESGLDGWEHKSLSVQDNNVFSIKSGSRYLEKWTGRGGAVGSASVSQKLTGLAPGQYELTAAAQNIQEDTPTKAQTGTWIYAGDKETQVTVRDTYTVAFSCVSGAVEIGFRAVDASGNWIAVDNFRLTLVGDDLSQELASAIEQTEADFGTADGNEAEQLLAAIANAKDVAANADATGQEQADAIIAMENAVDIYKRANASEENPLDMTGLIVNPSFETGDLTGWTAKNMGIQNNNVFNIKQGTYYLEKWTGRGGAVGDGQVSQTLTAMKPGKYRLTVAAQNIQEDTPTKEQTGVTIFANSHSTPVSVRNDYTLDFMLVSDELTIGYKAEGASGNWIAVDNFRLAYLGNDASEAAAEFAELISKAKSLTGERMYSQTKEKLDSAISAAEELMANGDSESWGEASSTLETAIGEAEESIDAFSQLAAAISAAREELSGSTSANKAEYEQAVDAAQAVYDAESTDNTLALSTIETLNVAAFAFKIENGSGPVPNVVTDKRFIRGCTWAFGRSTVSGSNILEQGFCWSENPDPKVTDHRTTEYINQAGRIYWLRNLKPATVYYIRAYAITKSYAVGYGEVLKVVTVPKGTIGHWYNNGGDEATNDRINYAINTSMDYYWNNLTSIHDFGISVSYSPGTPTADCSYGGSMRVGASSSYQSPGTIMHEALHGIGVGTHGMWWSSDMRSAGDRGDWLGDRVTEAVRFWDNNTTGVITGDNTHLWPYGCNGAHEDSHDDNLYCMMGILAQALNEDGLPGSDRIGYALPYYSFNHEDTIKYYIKNENEKYGLLNSYLVESADHKLEWQTMTAAEAAANDAAAWYLTFTPSNQYYQLRNAATGYYITYSSSGTDGIRTVKRTKPTNADNFHLMRGRVDVKSGKYTFRGYYVIHPESTANPQTLTGTTNHKTTTTGFNIAKSATQQRWLILTAEDATNFENGNINLLKEELERLIAQARKLEQEPHGELSEGADDTLENGLNQASEAGAATTSVSELNQLIEDVKSGTMAFLDNVYATDDNQPFDLTYLLENPNFNSSAKEGWTSAAEPGYNNDNVEFYEKTFNFYQTLLNMPSGTYELHANAFQRPGDYSTVYSQYAAGTNNVNTQLYINNAGEPVKNICDDRQKSYLFNDGGWGSDVQLGDKTYVPNCMDGAGKYFAKGLYESSVRAEIEESGSTLKVGIKGTKTGTAHWTIFDNFRLYYFGKQPPTKLKGDVNLDGMVDISDVVAVINTMAGDTTFKDTSDVNEDNDTNISDVVAIINIMAGQSDN